MHTWSLQLCPTLCDPMDHGLPGFSVHGIHQARIVEWVAISFYKSDLRRAKMTATREDRKRELQKQLIGNKDVFINSLV